jgi:hypothetical protein
MEINFEGCLNGHHFYLRELNINTHSEVLKLKAKRDKSQEINFQKTFKNIWKDKNKGVIFATPNGTKGAQQTETSNKRLQTFTKSFRLKVL